MKTIFTCLIFSFFLTNCSPIKIEKESYDLTIAKSQKAVLILFPCFPCGKEQTEIEADFLKDIEEEGITTLLLDFNQKLFLNEEEKIELAKNLNQIFEENKIDKKNIFIGGFSSGGNIAAVISNHLLKTKNSIQPKGVLVVDSPFDLEKLYKDSKSDIDKNFDENAVAEAKFLIQLLENELGSPIINIENYINASPYLISNNSTENIQYLKNIKTRFYCEPDLDWQLQFKNRKYEDLNAFKLERANNSLIQLGSSQTEFIKTENRGFRSNGQRHPHSWNIVDRESLVKWILE